MEYIAVSVKDKPIFQSFHTKDGDDKLYLYLERNENGCTYIYSVLGYTNDFSLVLECNGKKYLVRPSSLSGYKLSDREFVLRLKHIAYDQEKVILREITCE